MKLLLNENIRNYRKQMLLTQEQLAEAMGVSVATVSKWENGSVSPDVAMLAELADFFQISVDVLLGYEWNKRSMGQCAEYIRSLGDERAYEEGVTEAKKALQKYPNSFPVVYECGKLLFHAAENWNRERIPGRDREHIEHFLYAQTVLKKALELYEQNIDKSITKESMHQDVGTIYAYIGEREKAIEYLEEHNVCNVNDKLIGLHLCDMQQFERAWPYLSGAFRRSLVDLWNSYIGVWAVLIVSGRYEELLGVSNWMKNLCASLAAEESSYFLRVEAVTEAIIVTVYLYKEQQEKADYTKELTQHMQAALQEAVRFDNNPDYTGKIRFFEWEGEAMHDTFGDSAIGAVQHALRCVYDDVDKDRMISIYNDIAKSLELNDFLR